MKNLIPIVLVLLIGFTSCESSQEQNDDQVTDTAHLDNSQQSGAEQHLTDTLIYSVSSDEGMEGYDQQMKLYFLSDTSIWFSVDYEHAMAKGRIDTMAYRQRQGEFGQEFIQYDVQKGGFHYNILIDALDSSMAKIITASEIPTDVIPLNMPMQLTD